MIQEWVNPETLALYQPYVEMAVVLGAIVWLLLRATLSIVGWLFKRNK